MGIRSKLFLTLLALTATVVVGMLVFMRWSFERGLEEASERRSAARVERLSERLIDYHATYGSDEIQKKQLKVRSASVSPDKRSVRLRVDGLRELFVHALLAKGVRSADGEHMEYGLVWNVTSRGGGRGAVHLSGASGVLRLLRPPTRSLPELDDIWSDSKQGVAILHAETRDEFDDLDLIWQKVRNRMLDVKPR